mmetsp:Transcript_10592/g.18188  ORF Transcript_10592/g.18188 Transcript_10592/m.18188 type:complete len:217 (-) Transcript_10592:51-701(-)
MDFTTVKRSSAADELLDKAVRMNYFHDTQRDGVIEHLQFRLVQQDNEDELSTIYSIERDGYPADEAATYEKLKYRIAKASEFFLVVRDVTNTTHYNGIIGYVCSTLVEGALDEESMKVHHPDGTNLCVHSVCVDKPYYRKGIGSLLLRIYLQYVKLLIGYNKAHPKHPASSSVITISTLISKEYLSDLYTHVGYQIVRVSPVVHGKETWIEMVYGF